MTTETPARRARKTVTTPTGPARIPTRSAGFYRDPASGEKYRSVTTIINQGVPKEALVFWAGNVVAECAVENLPYLIRASLNEGTRTEAYDWLRRAHTRKKDERADVGSAVHSLIEAHILGTPVPDDLLADEELAPYLDQFLRFVAEWAVEFTASEMVVVSDAERYAGTLDYVLRSAPIVRQLITAGHLPFDADPDVELLGDTKTGGEICLGDRACVRSRPSEFKSCPETGHPIKGVYAEAGLQMSAYRAADSAWLRDGTRVPMPPTHPVGVVLHLRPEGYLLVPAACGPPVFDAFRYARRVAEWTTETSKTVLGAALTPARIEKAGAA